MQNKYIFHIAAANFLWSLIPVLVSGLFDQFSIITIIFLRFFIAGLILFLIGVSFIFYNNSQAREENMKISLKKLLRFTFYRNEAFFSIKYIYYFAILGFFGIILQIIGYFMALKATSIAFTMIGFQMSIILVAFYEHGIKAERLDLFKILYLLILIFSVGIIIFVKSQILPTHQSRISFEGVFYIILFTFCVSFLHIGMGKESYTKGELIFLNINNNYKISRLIIKLSLIFLMGTALLFPFIITVYILPIGGDLNGEIAKFFIEIPDLYIILLRWEILLLIFLSTILPYLLIFLARVKWSPYNLTYTQWGSILTIIEPIGGILFGVLLINEFFPIEFLVTVIFLLIMSILFRYAHETKNKVNAVVLLQKKQGILDNIALKLLKFEGVCCVDSLIGKHDLMVNIKTNSIKDFYYLINTQIRKLDGIIGVKILFIDKVYKLNN